MNASTPVHAPFEATASTCPTWAVPVTVGSDVFSGAAARTSADRWSGALLVPPRFVAVATMPIVSPTSAAVSVYEDSPAFGIGVQPVPSGAQRCQAYDVVIGSVPIHTGWNACSVSPTDGVPLSIAGALRANGATSAPVVDGFCSDTAVSVGRATAPPPAPTLYSSAGEPSLNRRRLPSALHVGPKSVDALATCKRPLPSAALITCSRFCASPKELTNAILVPSGEKTGSVSLAPGVPASVSRLRPLPSVWMVKMSSRDPATSVTVLKNAIVPFGPHDGCAPPWLFATCVRPVPSALTIQRLRPPPRVDENTICVPSGDHGGPSSRIPAPVVSCTELDPSTFAT